MHHVKALADLVKLEPVGNQIGDLAITIDIPIDQTRNYPLGKPTTEMCDLEHAASDKQAGTEFEAAPQASGTNGDRSTLAGVHSLISMAFEIDYANAIESKIRTPASHLHNALYSAGPVRIIDEIYHTERSAYRLA
jgi:hypothetical protein